MPGLRLKYDVARPFYKRNKTPMRNAYQTQKHRSKIIARNHDIQTADMIEVEDLSKKKRPRVRNVDLIQKNQTNESDTVDAMSELEEKL